MIKKKYLILLSTLLLVLLSSLFTTSYALTENEFKNVIYNYKVNVCNLAEENAENIVNNLTISNNISQYFDNENVGFFFWTKLVSGTNYNLNFCVITKNGYTNSSNKCITTSGTRWWLPANSYKLVGGRIYYNGDNITEFTGANTTLSNESITLFGTELDIYYTTSYSLAYQAGTWSNSISEEGPYLDTQFTYIYNPNLQNVTVEEIPYNNGQMKAITYSGVNNRDYLCVFGDYDFLDHVYMDLYRYNTNLGEWTHYKTIEPYTDYEVEDNQIRLYYSGNYYANTICMLGFIPKTR